MIRQRRGRGWVLALVAKRHHAGYTRGVILTAAPSLVFVIGVPAALLVIAGVVGGAAWMVLGRIQRG